MEKDTDNQAAEYHMARRYMQYHSTYEKIKATGKANAYSVSRFGSNRIDTFDELVCEVERLCATSEKNISMDTGVIRII